MTVGKADDTCFNALNPRNAVSPQPTAYIIYCQGVGSAFGEATDGKPLLWSNGYNFCA
ncbi:hypothetical protein LC593_26665 [Nostoc sp. CHAB 5844]|nr:hypothetical protein [Nostoc sp. CHAB 5844]